MKSHAQKVIDELKRRGESPCDAREATKMLGGRWRAFGVLDCPICGGRETLRIFDAGDSGIVAFKCVEGCAPDAVCAEGDKALGLAGVVSHDRQPWERDG